jgi:DNA-binding PadR family transcriptional regulator
MRAMHEATFLVLTSLAGGPQHGYAILADIAEMSGERVRLRAGTLYTALDRLRGDGLIEVAKEQVVDGRLRRYYRLTPQGSQTLADEAARLRSNATVALSRLGLGSPELGGA